MNNSTSSSFVSSTVLTFAAIACGWLALFAPVYYEFIGTAWAREENAHAPFVIAIVLGAGWVRLQQGGLALASMREVYAGYLLLSAGLLVYALGRAGGIDLFLSGSQLVIAIGVIFSLFGWAGVRRFWFPFLMMGYLIIWPGWALETATAPLKRFVSLVVSDGLFMFGLPVANSGAVISAGSYELLVADACAGLNSLIALTAVGAVYLYMVKRRSVKTNMAVILALAPLAILANIIRVGALVLITYFLGYDAGQSFLHEAAGLVMFAAALLGVFVVDAIAARIWEPRS